MLVYKNLFIMRLLATGGGNGGVQISLAPEEGGDKVSLLLKEAGDKTKEKQGSRLHTYCKKLPECNATFSELRAAP